MIGMEISFFECSGNVAVIALFRSFSRNDIAVHAAGYVKNGDSGFLKGFCSQNGIFRRTSAFLVVQSTETEQDGIILADLFFYRADNFQVDADAVGNGTAIFICSMIAERRIKLVKQIGMRRMKFDTIITRVFCTFAARANF